MFGAKLVVWVLLGIAVSVGTSYFTQADVERNRQQDVKAAFADNNDAAREARVAHWSRNQAYAGAGACWLALGVLMFAGDLKRALKRAALPVLALCVLGSTSGCGYRPFEPIQMEEIGSNEVGFLIPFTGDSKEQTSSNNEEYLKKNLVFAKQVKIPQQWVPKGFETFGADGNWKPAAKLIKVDLSPVTREWTADPNSGTSNKNEAIWVMTSDQVEFSTGWTVTGRIETREDAVKYLHNYPQGSLEKVMDTEVRGKLQTVFGLEVTDLPMDELRKRATPHIQTTVKEVTAFFKERGITLTNLGITGGFVYKDQKILDAMVRVFVAEQEKSIAQAKFSAQEVANKTVFSEAEGKAKALLATQEAQATGIKLVADAKKYEIEQAKSDLVTYLSLKRLEIEKDRWEKWDGRFPTTLMGSGSNGPEMMLQVPMPVAGPASSTTAPANKPADVPATAKDAGGK